jgi:hypothetical protein
MEKKKEGFKVPEGYFEGLDDAIFQKINEQGARKAPVLTAAPGGRWLETSNRRWLYGVAAAIALVAAAWWWLPNRQGNTLLAQADLTEEELNTYIVENASDFDVEQLALLDAAEQQGDTDSQEMLPGDTQKLRRNLPTGDFPSEELDNLLQDMSEEELEEIL